MKEERIVLLLWVACTGFVREGTQYVAEYYAKDRKLCMALRLGERENCCIKMDLIWPKCVYFNFWA